MVTRGNKEIYFFGQTRNKSWSSGKITRVPTISWLAILGFNNTNS